MKRNGIKLPFQGLTMPQWWRLGVASMLLTYLLLLIVNMWATGLFNYVGLDYRTFYASAQIASEHGFSKIYNMQLQEKYQRPLYEIYRVNGSTPVFETVPTPYLPIFIVPFFLFLPFSPPTGFILFIILSILTYLFYTRHLINKLKIAEETDWLILSTFAAVPLFFNLFYGQINIILYIFLGEFILSAQRGNDFKAGLLLASWMIKPQTLIFILPWFLITKRYHTLVGFTIGALAILSLSTLVAKGNWLTAWINLLLMYPNGLATTNPLAMMNWRGLALNLELLLPQVAAWSIAITGMILTFILMIKTWKRQYSESQFSLAILCTFSATFAITWHSHIHMALPLLAPIITLLAKKKFTYKNWMAFIGLQFLALVISIAARPWFPENNVLPMAILAVNIFLLQWGVREIQADDHKLLKESPQS